MLPKSLSVSDRQDKRFPYVAIPFDLRPIVLTGTPQAIRSTGRYDKFGLRDYRGRAQSRKSPRPKSRQRPRLWAVRASQTAGFSFLQGEARPAGLCRPRGHFSSSMPSLVTGSADSGRRGKVLACGGRRGAPRDQRHQLLAGYLRGQRPLKSDTACGSRAQYASTKRRRGLTLR